MRVQSLILWIFMFYQTSLVTALPVYDNGNGLEYVVLEKRNVFTDLGNKIKAAFQPVTNFFNRVSKAQKQSSLNAGTGSNPLDNVSGVKDDGKDADKTSKEFKPMFDTAADDDPPPPPVAKPKPSKSKIKSLEAEFKTSTVIPAIRPASKFIASPTDESQVKAISQPSPVHPLSSNSQSSSNTRSSSNTQVAHQTITQSITSDNQTPFIITPSSQNKFIAPQVSVSEVPQAPITSSLQHPSQSPMVNHPSQSPMVNHPSQSPMVNHPSQSPMINHPSQSPMVNHPSQSPMVNHPSQPLIVDNSSNDITSTALNHKKTNHVPQVSDKSEVMESQTTSNNIHSSSSQHSHPAPKNEPIENQSRTTHTPSINAVSKTDRDGIEELDTRKNIAGTHERPTDINDTSVDTELS
ncbi:hypothetical protein BATDEDRAFT_21806 [Batrachochytrium dendrobatidis JAM81]|uniref:Uncharacterized protein n=1 Tax=Batrachochytrium dendrobatidis (strain JAM81 / FGSC 10211) TaxID=684364 RepID=F4NVA8_BATDJ|nr:uncharacterized protein BATDEDRAFT_21806 [Batrachochytrium dendrobatidis JAM81]EGF83262.1 hypothetical protein BATDEDRAFT_21806 [Batrachochytrium dendrobatidis JAM81]|eukprot:XP_006675386.1 hypothetical protein BATDEDRAFT_21806 [Batrachochytrium dendrobatidis JAM81]